MRYAPAVLLWYVNYSWESCYNPKALARPCLVNSSLYFRFYGLLFIWLICSSSGLLHLSLSEMKGSFKFNNSQLHDTNTTDDNRKWSTKAIDDFRTCTKEVIDHQRQLDLHVTTRTSYECGVDWKQSSLFALMFYNALLIFSIKFRLTYVGIIFKFISPTDSFANGAKRPT